MCTESDMAKINCIVIDVKSGLPNIMIKRASKGEKTEIVEKVVNLKERNIWRNEIKQENKQS